MSQLENPPENPCFGCGPTHARGLRLSFRRERAPDGAEEVVTEYAPKVDEIGWPGLLHTGLHFTVLYEVSYWAALELSGKVMTSFGPASFDQKRLPRVGAPFTARARLVADAEGARVEARSESEGRLAGTLETSWRAASRARIEKAGLKLPEYLLADMDA